MDPFCYSKTCVKRTLKIHKTKILMTYGSLMKVESIIFDQYLAIICLGLNIFISQIDTYIYNNYKHYK